MGTGQGEHGGDGILEGGLEPTRELFGHGLALGSAASGDRDNNASFVGSIRRLAVTFYPSECVVGHPVEAPLEFPVWRVAIRPPQNGKMRQV